MKKQPIIILHGWGLSGERFGPLASLLSKEGYETYAPDLPGFGTSATPKRAYVLGDYASFVHSYMAAKHIQNPILIGHSFGGRVSLKFQMLYPAESKAVILTGTPGFTPVPRKKLVFFVAAAKIGKCFFQLPILNIIYDSVRKWYYYVVGARDFYRAQGVMRDIFKNIVQEELETSMRAVGVPCLLVWGALDRITPVWIAEKMEKTITGSRLVVIPDCDHGVSYKMPEVFVKAINPFLRSL